MAEYEIERKCKCCGKKIAVLAPSRWGYKTVKNKGGGYDYYCSWKCLRAEENRKKMKVTA